MVQTIKWNWNFSEGIAIDNQRTEVTAVFPFDLKLAPCSRWLTSPLLGLHAVREKFLVSEDLRVNRQHNS
jgi:hypothetical protein